MINKLINKLINKWIDKDWQKLNGNKKKISINIIIPKVNLSSNKNSVLISTVINVRCKGEGKRNKNDEF